MPQPRSETVLDGLRLAATARSLAVAALATCFSVPAAPSVAAASPGSLDLPRAQDDVLFVHVQGDDGNAGTRAAPLRTLTAALERARSREEAPVIRVAVGTYDAAAGERFPLDLTGGARIVGLGSRSVRIDAGAATSAFRLGTEAAGRAELTGVAVAGERVGIALGAATGEGAHERSLLLQDVLLEGFETGVALDLGTDEAPLPIDLVADGLRTRSVAFGLRALGEGRLRLTLARADLRDGTVGLMLESEPGEDVDNPRTADEEGVARVHHEVLLADSTFAGMSRAGVLRVGRDGRNDGAPYTVRGCTFEGNFVGLEFRRPCLDSELHVLGSTFRDNEQFGLRVAGDLGAGEDATGTTRIEDCSFRWNGVGAHVTNAQLPLHVARSRFEDNLGNGLFVSNFMTEPTLVRIESSLFARNGSHGIYSLADARLQSVAILGCTVVDNDAGGVRDHRRHSGTSEFELRGCILAGNGAGADSQTGGDLDLADVDPNLALDCWIGGVKGRADLGESVPDRGIVTGSDPGFLDRARGDYRLTPDSPCRGLLGKAAARPLPPFDLDGNPVGEGLRSLGCWPR